MSEHGRSDDTLLANHIHEEMERYKQIDERLDRLERNLERLLDLWSQARGVVNFVKIVAAIGTAVAASYVFLHNHFTVLPK